MIYNVTSSFGEIDWDADALVPGDEIRIHWKATPYFEKLLFNARGSATNRILVTGVSGPNGEKPVISGFQATTNSQFVFTNAGLEATGLFTVHRRSTDDFNYRPGYVTFRNLEFKDVGWHNGTGVNRNFTKTDTTTGTYAHEAGAFYLLSGDSIWIEDCIMSRCGNGVILVGGAGTVTDFRMYRNWLYGNGWIETGFNAAHNVYIEALGAIYEHNRFGRPAMGGSANLKDRSAGVIVRNNRIEGSARLVDLSSAGDTLSIAETRDDYHLCIVENNQLIFTDDPRDGIQVMYCEGRTDNQGRIQTVRFRNNTVICYRNGAGDQNKCIVAYSWETHGAGELWPRLEADKNLFWVHGKTQVAGSTLKMFRYDGHVEFGPNVIPTGWELSDSGICTMNGEGNLTEVDPFPTPFVDVDHSNGTLAAGSPYAGFGCSLGPHPRDALRHDGVKTSLYQSAQSSYSFTHSCFGLNLFLAVDVSILSPSVTVTGITYNGVALTSIGARSTVTSMGRVECWGLVAPPEGLYTVTVTLSGSANSSATAASYTGVNQANPTGTFQSNQATNGSATDATVDVTTTKTGSWVRAALATDDANVTANQTALSQVNGAAGTGATEHTGPLNPTTTAMSFTGVGAGATWAMGAYELFWEPYQSTWNLASNAGSGTTWHM